MGSPHRNVLLEAGTYHHCYISIFLLTKLIFETVTSLRRKLVESYRRKQRSSG